MQIFALFIKTEQCIECYDKMYHTCIHFSPLWSKSAISTFLPLVFFRLTFFEISFGLVVSATLPMSSELLVPLNVKSVSFNVVLSSNSKPVVSNAFFSCHKRTWSSSLEGKSPVFGFEISFTRSWRGGPLSFPETYQENKSSLARKEKLHRKNTETAMTIAQNNSFHISWLPLPTSSVELSLLILGSVQFFFSLFCITL